MHLIINFTWGWRGGWSTDEFGHWLKTKKIGKRVLKSVCNNTGRLFPSITVVLWITKDLLLMRLKVTIKESLGMFLIIGVNW